MDEPTIRKKFLKFFKIELRETRNLREKINLT